MNTNRGIFESLPNQSATRPDSPFEIFCEPTVPVAAASPFTVVARVESPFKVVDKADHFRPVEPGRPARVPERRKPESPFQIAEPSEGFGFEAPAKAYPVAPFEAPSASPQQQAGASPFSVESQRGPSSASTQAVIAAFGNWQEPPVPGSLPAPVPQAFAQPTPSAFAPAPVPAGLAPVSQAAVEVDASHSDSFAIRQLELRAIFGVDRELNSDEILQRSRTLPGMCNIARVSRQDMATLEALKQLLPNLGFGSGGLKLYSDSVALEFIREGGVMLAVQTDGGFAPGVRETLMLVARELERLS